MSNRSSLDGIGCLKIWGFEVLGAVIIVLCIALYNYFSIKPLPKEELIQRGVEYFDRNRKDFNSVVNALHLLKFPIDNRGAEVKISSWTKLPSLHHTGNDSIFRKINESVYDSIVSLKTLVFSSFVILLKVFPNLYLSFFSICSKQR